MIHSWKECEGVKGCITCVRGTKLAQETKALVGGTMAEMVCFFLMLVMSYCKCVSSMPPNEDSVVSVFKGDR